MGSHWHKPDRVKTCIMCKEELPLSSFYAYGYTTKQGKRSTRYESRCRDCAAARRREAYHADPSKHQAISNRWKEANREHLREYSRERQKDPALRAMKAKSQRMRKARIRASSDNQSDAIRAIYAKAIEAEQIIKDCPVFDVPELTHKVHVDHIQPLAKGGLHVAENLQLLPAGINMRKGVSWEK